MRRGHPPPPASQPTNRTSRYALFATRQNTASLSDANKLLIRCAWDGPDAIAFASAGYGGETGYDSYDSYGGREGGGEGGGEGEGEGGGVAVDETWQQFQAVCDVLRVYGALEGYAATELGELVGALSGDNELWLALVLIEVAAAPQLRPAQLAAVLAATLDERARPGAYVGFAPSEEVLEMVETLGGRAEALQRVQVERGVGFGVGIEPGSVGLVEAWAEGVSWPQLMAGTSLDAGDIFRLLKRTVELLRQVRYLVITPIP